MTKTKKVYKTPRQKHFTELYLTPTSLSYGNSYKSAIRAGYSDTTARNMTHLKPQWLSETIGNVITTISPEKITEILSSIIYDKEEPTVSKLKALELMMKFYKMIGHDAISQQIIEISLDLTGGTAGPIPQNVLDELS